MRELQPGQIDSVGRQEHRAFYAAYMRSPRWYQRRAQWLREERSQLPPGRRVRCVGGCGKLWLLSRDHLHHVSYDRLGDEAHEDLWPMCSRCHAELHELLSSKTWRKLERGIANQLVLNVLISSHESPGDLEPETSTLRDYL